MYLGNMQITMLLAEPTSWKTELERTVKGAAEWDILYRNMWLHSLQTDTYSQNCLMKRWRRASTDVHTGGSAIDKPLRKSLNPYWQAKETVS